MNLILFIVVLLVSLIVVRIGAIAFQLTGLEWSLAQFQALSCFTGTGFTTRESELITSNVRRRKIASVLMVLGNAGLVTLVATFANTLRPSPYSTITVPVLGIEVPPSFLPWINLVVILFVIYVGNMVLTHTRLAKKFTDGLRGRILKRELVKNITFEELIISTGGYGVSNIEIREDSPILNKSILEAELRKEDITILVVEREGRTIPNPPPDTHILLRDRLICFGRVDNIRKKLCAVQKEA